MKNSLLLAQMAAGLAMAESPLTEYRISPTESGLPFTDFNSMMSFSRSFFPLGQKPFVLPEDMDTPELTEANRKIKEASEKLEQEKIKKARLKRERRNQ